MPTELNPTNAFGEFPSPCGEEVLKDNTGVPMRFRQTAANVFPSPCGEEVLKEVDYMSCIPDLRKFPSPCGEEVLKAYWGLWRLSVGSKQE